MRYIVSILLISFITLAIFGALGMHISMQGHEGNCVVAQIKGVDCPKQNSFLDYINFHLNAYKDLTVATLNPGSFITYLLILLLFILVTPSQIIGFKPPKLSYLSSQITRGDLSFLQKKEFTRWLALHENSPTLH